MKRLFIILFSVSCLVACHSAKTVSGIILDAAMHSMVVLTTDGDTLSVSTVEAQRVAEDGILIGDHVDVLYDGKTVAQVTVTKGNREVMLMGSWTQPIEGMSGVQGICFKENGVASSINMSTLLYERWLKEGDTLTLWGKSLGNGQTIDFEEKYHIDRLDDKLVLTQGSITLEYARDYNH